MHSVTEFLQILLDFRIQFRTPIEFVLEVSSLILAAIFSCLCSSEKLDGFYLNYRQEIKTVALDTRIWGGGSNCLGINKLRIFQHTQCFDNSSNCHGTLIKKHCQDHIIFQ